jgi:hypothetical protein
VEAGGAQIHDVKKFSRQRLILASALGVGVAWMAAGQLTRTGVGRNFMFPDYYPITNGVARKKSVLTGEESRLVTNNVIALTHPRIEFFRPDGTNLEWTAIARECVVDIGTREVSGTNKIFYRTAEDSLFQTGKGFLWQQSNGVLILSNDTFTWIDIRTNSPGRTNKMKSLVAASLVATARLTAAEMEIPPQRPGVTITAGVNMVFFKTNHLVILSNGVLVTYPSPKTNEPTTYLRSEWATARRGTNGEWEEVVAQGRVALDKGSQHARGNYAIYTASNDMVSLVGTYDPKQTNYLRPYLYESLWTNGVEVIKWVSKGDAIIYNRRAEMLTTPGGVLEFPSGDFKFLSSPVQGTTNKAPSDADRPRKTSPNTK